jgi:uncharacterized protein with PIN domain
MLVKRMIRHRETHAAILVQSRIRAKKARQMAHRLRLAKEEARRMEMVIRIQSNWRRRQAQALRRVFEQVKTQMIALRNKSAKSIQRAWRSYGWRQRHGLYQVVLRANIDQTSVFLLDWTKFKIF